MTEKRYNVVDTEGRMKGAHNNMKPLPKAEAEKLAMQNPWGKPKLVEATKKELAEWGMK